MATLETAEELLEQLRAASYDAAQRDLQDIKDFAAEQGFTGELAQVGARRAGVAWFVACPIAHRPDCRRAGLLAGGFAWGVFG